MVHLDGLGVHKGHFMNLKVRVKSLERCLNKLYASFLATFFCHVNNYKNVVYFIFCPAISDRIE